MRTILGLVDSLWHVLPQLWCISNQNREADIPNMAKIATNTTHIFSLNVYVLWTKKLTDICILLFYPPLDIFLAQTKLLYVNKRFLHNFFNEGGPLLAPQGSQTRWGGGRAIDCALWFSSEKCL